MRGNCGVLASGAAAGLAWVCRARYLHQGRVDNLGDTHNLELSLQMVASNSDMFTHYMPVAFLTSYLKSSWVTRGRFIVLAPKKYDIVGGVPMDNRI